MAFKHDLDEWRSAADSVRNIEMDNKTTLNEIGLLQIII